MQLKYIYHLSLSVLICLISLQVIAQKASIQEETRTLKTYDFSDPNPIPILTKNPKIYPYFTYDGYSSVAENKEWKVIKLENDLIEVYVLPEVGGKVWGAIEKSTGKEFIYRNEVMKFRNISMRGPWTSGGIEFNFGIIGHHPSTATPVDYVIQEHDDGSVSCTVGNIDLPSRTQWRVEIILPKDKAFFETKAHWYNPSSVQQSYYNWMTAAAPARQDFEFFTPGDQYLTHPGEAKSWPYDELGRDLSLYKENNFGPSKSYHVVGEYNDFFGGYYHDAQYGFGHWGEYEAIPGQKLWLWALSRSGGIWEDLLTDTDGQYIEFQAGRLFVQYSPGDHVNPITQATFEAHGHDIWTELWFPVKEIGGMNDVSEKAVMNVKEKEGRVEIGINCFQETDAELLIVSQGKTLVKESLRLGAMEVFNKSYDLKGSANVEVIVEELDLHYTTNPKDRLIERPFDREIFPEIQNSAEKLFLEGIEEYKYRNYALAKDKFEQALQFEPRHIAAMNALAELHFRRAEFDKGLRFTNKALQLDTYHPEANYLAGILYRAKGDYINAKESLGWAARSLAFRSNAYAQMAEILLLEGKLQKAIVHAEKSIDFNRYNMHAWQVLTIAGRKNEDKALAEKAISNIMEMDAINHFARFEKYLLSGSDQDKQAFQNAHQSELVYQSYLELALDYFNKGQYTSAKEVLHLAPEHPLIHLWSAFLANETSALDKMDNMPLDLVFPFRRETLAALSWALEQKDSWKLSYYQALLLWGLGRGEEAADLLESIEDRDINFAAFYQSRAYLLKAQKSIDPYADLKQALAVGRKDWRNWKILGQYYTDQGKTREALELMEEANELFPDNYALGLDHAQALIHAGRYKQAITAMNDIDVLPFEGASAGRKLYETAHYYASIGLIEQKKYKEAIDLLNTSKLWPENLGVGKPFDPDERIADYLLGYIYYKTNNIKKSKIYWEACSSYTKSRLHQASLYHVLGVISEEKLSGKEEGRGLLESLLSSKHGKSSHTQWIAAYVNQNKDRLTQIENKTKISASDNYKLLSNILMLK